MIPFEVKAERQSDFGQGEDDFPETPVSLRYLLITTPRTGSTMLSSALFATRLAGNPREYLNQYYLRPYLDIRGPTSPSDYLADVLRRRTSSNGRFGMKMHFEQFNDLFAKQPAAGIAFLKQFQRFVRIYRRDKLDQAISWTLAKERQIWNVQKPEQVPADRGFKPSDVENIIVCLQKITTGERAWQGIQEKYGLQPSIDVAYEDLVADARRETSRVLQHIGVDIPVEQLPPPATRKLAREGSREIRHEFLRAIGVTETTIPAVD